MAPDEKEVEVGSSPANFVLDEKIIRGMSQEEKAAYEQASYKLLQLQYAKGDIVLEGHIISKISDIYNGKPFKMPEQIKDLVEEESVRIREELGRKILEKKKDYNEILQSGLAKKDAKARGTEAETMGPQENETGSGLLDYEQSLALLEEIEKKKGMKLGLGNMTTALEMFGNPHKKFKSIHVAGTNGKGSVCAMLDNILLTAGFKTGRYTSPHLINFNERIMINGKEISDEKVADLVNRVRPYLKKIDLTYFEIVTLMAFLHFMDEKVDYALVEVGMGGRLDATNVLVPLISIVTNIDLDHTEHLGSTIKEIAYEKAGIIKDGIPVVTGCEGPALEVMESTCGKKNARLLPLVRHRFTTEGLSVGKITGIHLGLKGEFQHKNAELAIAAALALQKSGVGIDEREIKIGLSNTDWPGRLDFIENNVVIDCAHNPAGIKVLVSELERLKKRFDRIILVFGAMKDKDYRQMLARLSPIIDVYILTRADTDRAETPDTLSHEVEKYKHDYIIMEPVSEAVQKARSMAGPRELVVIAGSIYVAGEALAFLQGSGEM